MDTAQNIQNKHATLGNYSLIKTIGAGYNSRVKLGMDLRNGEFYAIKIIKHSDHKLNLNNVKKEVDILMNLKHPNIVNLVDYFEDIEYTKKNGGQYKVVAIVLELVPGGELFEYLLNTGKFSEEVARTYFQILIQTIEYCHSQGIVHRDLKPENLLLDKDFNLKVADFGFGALIRGQDGTGQLHTVLGTETYMAPEIYLKQPYSGPAVDLFACSIVLFILVSGNLPFKKAVIDDPFYKLLCANKQDLFWGPHEKRRSDAGDKKFSPEFKSFMNTMLALDPAVRLTLPEIKAHPWYKGDIVSIKDLKGEFEERKVRVDQNLQERKKAKQEEKIKIKNQLGTNAPFNGYRPFRDIEAGLGESIKSKLNSKVNFEAGRKILPYEGKTGFKPVTEVQSLLSPDVLFKFLFVACQGTLNEFKANNDTYKIIGKAFTAQGTCELKITITSVDDTTCCVEFHKKNGNGYVFYEVAQQIGDLLPTVEIIDDGDKENKDQVQLGESVV